MSALLDALARHRGLLVGCYLALLVGYCWLFSAFFFFTAPEGLRYVIPGQSPFEGDFESDWKWATAAFVALLALQAMYLWGGGRVTLAKKPAGSWRLLTAVLIGSGLLAGLFLGLVATLLGRVDRWTTDTDISIRADSLLSESVSERLFGLFLVLLDPGQAEGFYQLTGFVVVWGVFLIVGLVALRGVDRQTALTRVTSVLLAGSWLEFLVALPVDIATRRRAEDCPCTTGSWLALAFAIPVMLFAFGPGLYLLYLREIRLGRRDPRHSRRVLLRKSKAAGEK